MLSLLLSLISLQISAADMCASSHDRFEHVVSEKAKRTLTTPWAPELLQDEVCLQATAWLQEKVLLSRSRSSPAGPGSGWESLGFECAEPETKLLHIGKTGGSSLKVAYNQIALPNKLLILTHQQSKVYMDMERRIVAPSPPADQDIIFFVRAPVHRFVSAWLSTYLKDCDGQADPSCVTWKENLDAGFEIPQGIPWSPAEKSSIDLFPTPDDLACSLSSWNASVAAEAAVGMRSLYHVANDLKYYFGGLQGIQAVAPQIRFVGRAEHFDDDYRYLTSLLVARHAFSETPDREAPSTHASDLADPKFKQLSSCAVLNLHKWYAEDYQIIRFLSSHGLIDHSYPVEVNDLDAAPPEGQYKEF